MPSCTPQKRCTLNWRSGINIQSVVSPNSLVHKQTAHTYKNIVGLFYENKSLFFKDELM